MIHAGPSKDAATSNASAPERARRSQRQWLVLVATALSGCAAMNPPQFPWEAGWRYARVSESGRRDTNMKKPFRDCRTHKEADAFIAFVRASYRHSSSQRHIISPIESTDGLEAGDIVYVNIKNCAEPAIRKWEASDGQPRGRDALSP